MSCILDFNGTFPLLLDYVQTHAFFYHDGDIHVHTIWSHHIQELRSLRYFSPSARRDCTPEIKSWMHQVTSEPSATVIDSNNAGDTAEVYSYFHTDPRAMQANLALLEICLVVVLFG